MEECNELEKQFYRPDRKKNLPKKDVQVVITEVAFYKFWQTKGFQTIKNKYNGQSNH